MSILTIDPNEVVLGDNHPFKRTGLGIPNFEEIRSYAELSMTPKNSNYIEIDNGNVSSSNKTDFKKIILTGFYTRKDINYYSTNYTEDGRAEYEGFGIQDINITFDANKIPVVTITFYDFRGNVLNNLNSKFANMFQLPYPVFNLKIKGGLGPIVDYKLRKIRDDISIDDTGNFVIKSKFIGDRFSPLSDLPLNYLQAVAFLRGDKDINAGEIESFYEFTLRIKSLYSRISEIVESKTEENNREKLDEENEKLVNLINVKNFLNKRESVIGVVTESDFYKNSNNKDNIENYINLLTINNNIIKFQELIRTLPPQIPSQNNYGINDFEYQNILDLYNQKINNFNIDNNLIDVNPV
jgi:hypothetical protein